MDAAEKKARAEVRCLQAAFERAQEQRDEVSAARRKGFERAQQAGLSTRDIATETGLHHSRIAEIPHGGTRLSGPAQIASGLDIRPHECRHSYVTHLRAEDINDANLAEIVGRCVETMLARYTHGSQLESGTVCDWLIIASSCLLLSDDEYRWSALGSLGNSAVQ